MYGKNGSSGRFCSLLAVLILTFALVLQGCGSSAAQEASSESVSGAAELNLSSAGEEESDAEEAADEQAEADDAGAETGSEDEAEAGSSAEASSAAETVSSSAAQAESEEIDLENYGINEIPTGYSIYKDEEANYSFLYLNRLIPQDLSEKNGVIFYTDDQNLDYCAAFADDSKGNTPEEYLKQVGDHFMESAASNGFEVYEEPVEAEPLTLNGRTLQGIRYGNIVDGTRIEYVDYIEVIPGTREKDVMVYEQHIVENSGNTAELALRDAVASFVPNTEYYDTISAEVMKNK